jgi:hypothetical protein
MKGQLRSSGMFIDNRKSNDGSSLRSEMFEEARDYITHLKELGSSWTAVIYKHCIPTGCADAQERCYRTASGSDRDKEGRLAHIAKDITYLRLLIPVATARGSVTCSGALLKTEV